MPANKKTTKTKTHRRGTDSVGAAAAVVRKIVALHGGKRTVAQKLGNSLSRPLLVALCNGERATTTASVAELCRVCPADLAADLIAAHLQDELARIQGRYAPKGSLLTEGMPWSGAPGVSVSTTSTAKADDGDTASAALAAARRLSEPFPDHREIRLKSRKRFIME